MANRRIVKARPYKVKDGDSIESIAMEHGISWQELAKFNWGTEIPKEINKFLRGRMGCTKKSKDKLNYIFTSNDDPGILHIPEEMSSKTFSSSSTHTIKVKMPELNILPPAKIAVKFWPHAAWGGEFGFDWMREGLSGIIGDVAYKVFVGKYPDKKDPDWDNDPTISMIESSAQYAKLKALYNPFIINDLDASDGSSYENMTVWLNLFPKDECKGKPSEAKLIANIELFEGVPESLMLECDKADYKDYIELDKDELPKATCKEPLSIKSKKACPTDIIINVVNHTNDLNGMADHKVVGKLVILKNDKANRYKANVVFVPVISNINGLVNNITDNKSKEEKEFLEKYLFQSLSSLDYKNIKIDLTVDQSFWGKIVTAVKSIFGLPEEFNSRWVIKDDEGQNAIANRLPDGSKIHDFLEEKFNNQYPELSGRHKVFFFNEPGGYYNNKNIYVGLNGGAKGIPSTCVVLYDTHNNSTTTHELLHAMGLYHTFSNDGDFTFKKGETENIMDYSHLDEYGNKNRISTWKWQWSILRKKLTKE